MRLFGGSDEDDYPWKDDEPIGFGASLRADRREKWEFAKRLVEEGGTSHGDQELEEMMRIAREKKK